VRWGANIRRHKIITGSRDRTIRVWDIKTYKCLKVIGSPESRPQYSETQDALPVHSRAVPSPRSVNGTPEGNAIYHVPADYHSASILSLQFDSEILVTGSSDSDCIVWDISTYEPRFRLRHHTMGVLDVCFDSNLIVTCSKDHTIGVWARKTGDILQILHGHHGPVNAVQLRGNLLVSASGDGVAKLWNLTSGVCVKEFVSRDRGLAAVEFSSDAAYVLAGGNDNVIYKFSTASGELVHSYMGHQGLVRSLFLDAHNNRVVSGSYDQSIKVYNYREGRLMAQYPNWTTSWILAAKCDYRRIVATSQDGRALILDFGLEVKGKDLLNG
jgi:F-box and WD-40 domain protein 1/11